MTPPAGQVTLKDGRKLAFAEHGDRDGRPIIHCHGAPSSRVEGNLILDAAVLSALRLRVIVPDRPGMGESDPHPARRIVDWADDVSVLADALGLRRFAVLGSSGGTPYATVCGALLPRDRVPVIGLVGAIGPLDAPDGATAMTGALKMMFSLARSAPPLLRALLAFNLHMMRAGGERANQKMAAWAPEPDRTLLQQPAVAEAFKACFEESCRQGTRGAVLDLGLIARPWGFRLSDVRVPVLLWHGEKDHNVLVAHGRYLAAALPECHATFYPEDGHLSTSMNHQQEILGALASVIG
jgi:pimeloyl-ACP methyl ester carboxylesterase